MGKHALTLHALRSLDQQLHDLLVESCGDRSALASVLLAGIAAHAAEQATRLERERCAAHITLAEASRGRGVQIAFDAIRSGASTIDLTDLYQQAADERRDAKLQLIASMPAKEGP